MSSDRLRIRRGARVLAVAVIVLGLGACAESQFLITAAKKARDDGSGQQSAYKVGKPYQINGVWYYPAENYDYDETGIASWYGPQFHGKLTANGEVYDMNDVTAAHRTLPMPSIVRVVNLDNGRSLVVRVNDRGPYARSRIIDLSRRSAQLLGFEGKGTARVRVQVMADESRVIAARAQGKGVVRPDASLTVDRLPKASVSSQSIPPPGGGTAAPAPKAPETQVASAEPAAPTPPVTSSKVGQITQGAPVATRIYVQAGAFGQYDNANRVRAKLAGVGPTQISSVLVNGRDLFRVRVGPLANVAEADHLLDSVIRSGYPEARVIVD